MQKSTNNNYPINSLTTKRWSTRLFDNRPVEKEKILSILEAARWAASAFNAQPWRFIVGINNDDDHKKILSTLIDWNIQWAKNAPVLILNIAEKKFSHNAEPNPTYKYDLGQAVAFMTLEATSQGLFSHQMTGFNPNKAHTIFNLPDELKVVSVTAVGYYSADADVPNDILKLEEKPRERIDLDKIVLNRVCP